MDRLTRRAEAEGIKAVYYGKNDVFLEGEPGYAEANKLAHYEDLEESGRLVVLPDRKSRTLLSKALLNSDICPRNLGMEEIDPCTPDADCESCWEAALEGGGQDE